MPSVEREVVSIHGAAPTVAFVTRFIEDQDRNGVRFLNPSMGFPDFGYACKEGKRRV